MPVSATIGMVTALAKVAVEHYKTKPNYEQKVEREAKEKIAQYEYELNAQNKDNRLIDELETWLKIFAEDLL